MAGRQSLQQGGRCSLHLWGSRDGQDSLCHSPPSADEGAQCDSDCVCSLLGVCMCVCVCVCLYFILCAVYVLYYPSPPFSLTPTPQSSLSGVKVLAVNCMSVTSPQALYLHLATSLQLQQSAGRGKKKETARERVLRHITTSKKLL